MMNPQKPPERGAPSHPERPGWTPQRAPQPKRPDRQVPERKPEIFSPSRVEEEEEVGQIEEV